MVRPSDGGFRRGGRGWSLAIDIHDTMRLRWIGCIPFRADGPRPNPHNPQPGRDAGKAKPLKKPKSGPKVRVLPIALNSLLDCDGRRCLSF